jgi:hypothetical protein
MKKTILALTLAACLLPTFATPTASATTALPHALVLSARATPTVLPPTGGQVHVTATVKNATTCQLELLSHQSFPIVYASNIRPCAGRFSAHVIIGANPGTLNRTVAFALVARNQSSASTGYFYVMLRQLPSPVILSVGATPQQLGPFGGTTTITGSVKNAKTCRLELLSQQGFPVDYASNRRPCTDHFAAHVIISPNTSAVHRTIAFALVVSDGPSSFIGKLYVGMAGSSRPAAPSATTTVASAVTTTTPAATTTTPAATTTLPPSATTTVAGSGVQQLSSSNWSGYAVTGGPFTGANATFTVPFITTAASCSAHVSEWVGIDGFNPPGQPADSPLIQAGIDESDTNPATDQCTPGSFFVWPWWEVLPAPEQLPANWQGASVSAGDKVTVTIGQVSGGTWAMELTDHTGGGSFIADASFGGSDATAEWIVEASSDAGDCNGVCPLAEYTNAHDSEPGVTFSKLGLEGTDSTWYQIAMVQDGLQVSTPSAYSTNAADTGVTGFSVSYTGVGGSGFRVPALVEVGRTPKGRFVHPIYGAVYGLVDAANRTYQYPPPKSARVFGHVAPAPLGA